MDKEKAKRKFIDFITWNMDDVTDIYERNEIMANKISAITLFNCALLDIITLILAHLHVFHFGNMQTYLYVAITMLEFLIPAIICFARRGRGKWVKYMLLVGSLLGVTLIYIFFNSTVVLLMLLPLLLSCRYYDSKYVFISAIVTIVLLAVGCVCGALYGSTDFNVFEDNLPRLIEILQSEEGFRSQEVWGEAIRASLQNSFLPNFLLLIAISVICVASAKNGRRMANEEKEIVENTVRISSELSLATDIQANMLPRIFPPFPNHKEFDIYALMQPAKEVGGDFYDFFMVDDTHIAFVIGDVSGKGVPAALFMVTAKTLIKDHTQLGMSPAEVFTRINKILCEGNDAGLFVTGWLGEMDLKTGTLTYVNAGHNPPLLKHGDGSYEYLKSKAGFVLAGLPTMRYKQATIELTQGDRLFLYTDGVTEATNTQQKLYGEQRLKDYFNATKDETIEQIVTNLKSDIDGFVGEAEQFDDITMLLFDYRRQIDDGLIEKVYVAKDENLAPATEFMDELLHKANVPSKVCMQMDVVLEELFVNVAHYAYPRREGNVKLAFKVEEHLITLVIKDSGIPFNPLAKEDPNISLSAEDRDIGGLGIFMVKKTMTTVNYEYVDGMNVLSMTKEF